MGIVIHTSNNDVSPVPVMFAGAGGVIRTMVALVCLLSLTACGGQRYNTFFVETPAKPYWKALAKPAPYPLARTLTWKYYFTSDPGNYQAFVADGKVMSSKPALLSMNFYASKPATAGVRMSDVYALRAREAERGGQRHMRDAYQTSSEVALRSEIANQRIEVGLGFGQRTRRSGRRVGQGGDRRECDSDRDRNRRVFYERCSARRNRRPGSTGDPSGALFQAQSERKRVMGSVDGQAQI